MKIINNRYKLLDKYNKDIYGTTYIAVDMLKNNEKVFLKIFNIEFSDSHFIECLIDNFIEIQSVNHEYILRNKSLDIINTIDNKEVSFIQYFYTTEYVDEENIDYKNLSKKDILDIIIKICYALNYLHFRGLVYKYLNFDNIIILKDKNGFKIKLRDLVHIKQYGMNINTIDKYKSQFIAPELKWGKECHFGADIYSLGVMFFYLSNNLNYEENIFTEIFKRNNNSGVNVLIKKMTEIECNERYKNISEFILDFRKYYKIKYDFFDRAYYEKLNFKIKLIGRTKDKKIALEVIQNINSKDLKTNSMFVHGEIGIGKTRFLKEIMYILRMKKIDACFIELNQDDNDIYYLYKNIIRYIVKQRKFDIDLINKYGNEIVKILPDLSKKWNVIPSETLKEDKEILRLNNRIYNFICDYVSNNPLIIIIDNIQHLHKNDLKILNYLLRNNKNIPLVVLGSYRDEEDCKVIDFLNELRLNGETKFIQLSRLNYEEIALMLKNILGMGWKPLKLTTKIMEETNGNPRYVEEIIKNLYMEKMIKVGNNRKWYAEVDDIYNLKLPENIDDAILNSIQSFDDTTKNILNIISIFHTPVSKQIICSLINEDYDKINEILLNLVSLKILNEKFEDWGYTYDFYNKKLKKYLYLNLDKNIKVELHKNAAVILEELFINEGRQYVDELIYHLKSCNLFEKAIKYCIASAKKMRELHIYTQSIIFYNKAIELLDKYHNDEIYAQVLLDMGQIYLFTGEIDNAYNVYAKCYEISKINNYSKQIVDSKNKLASIYLNRNEIVYAKQTLMESIELSKKIDYIEGELDAALLQCKLNKNYKGIKDFKYFLDKYLKISFSNEYDYYIAEFLNEKGKMYYYDGDFDKALDCFKQSIEHFSKTKDFIRITSPLNNIGVIYVEAIGDFKKGREHFYRALDMIEKHNLITGKGVYYLNIGETYLIEDNYNKALENINRAIKICEEIEERDVLFSAYVHLCEIYLAIYQYDKVNTYLQKLETEFKTYSLHDKYYFYYYQLRIYYYIKIRNFVLAEKWYQKALREIDIENNSKKILDIYKFYIDFYKTKNVDVYKIKYFLKDNLSNINYKLLRNFILDLTSLMISRNEIKHAKYFFDIDDNLKNKFNTVKLQLKRDFVMGLFNRNKIEYFENYLKELQNNNMLEYEWRVYKILGDEYYSINEYYKSLSNYITSMDTLKRLTNRVPEKLRENYLFVDDDKIMLKEKVDELKTYLADKDDTVKKSNVKKRDIINDFFDLSDYKSLFKNKQFLKLVYKEYRNKFPIQVSDLKTLINNLKSDELYNIELILQYCLQLCIAERGFVFISNENNKIEEVIKVDDNQATKEVLNFIESVKQSKEEIIIFNTNEMSKENFLMSDIKAMICIPISKEKSSLSNPQRRKYEDAFNNEVVGYLYLDTNRVFNNFTNETYKMCKSLINLLYVMIENYNLIKISSIDKLTNVYLRKYIEDLFKKELAIARSNGHNLSIVMCDIDKFKQVNDVYGHMKGDEVLSNLGRILKENLRKTDLIGRYGGEEFIIVLPQTDEKDAYYVCEKIRKKIEDSKLLGKEKSLTISFGISTYPVHGLNEEELIEKADQALYKSKIMGRNKTTIWNKNIGKNKYRYDKLAGILTGDFSIDHRNVLAMVEMIESIKYSKNKEERIYDILGHVIEISDAKKGAIFIVENKSITKVYAREKVDEKWLHEFNYNKEVIEDFIGRTRGDYFIDWNEIAEIDSFTGIPNWNSLIIIPLNKDGVQKGILMLSVPINEKEFDFGTFNLVDSLAGIIATMI